MKPYQELIDFIAETTDLLARMSLAGAPVVAVSATTGIGLDGLRAGLLALRDRVAAEQAMAAPGPRRLSVDRAFVVRGRGLVVTGSLRGPRWVLRRRTSMLPNDVASGPSSTLPSLKPCAG